jgi:uncharacterized protein
VRFACLPSCGGKCCKIGATGGFVFLTRADILRIVKNVWQGASQIKLGRFEWTRFMSTPSQQHYLEQRPSGDCCFYKQGRCSIYESRPTQCRTFPFWPELVFNQEKMAEASQTCPGIGVGDELPEYHRELLQCQVNADQELRGHACR